MSVPYMLAVRRYTRRWNIRVRGLKTAWSMRGREDRRAVVHGKHAMIVAARQIANPMTDVRAKAALPQSSIIEARREIPAVRGVNLAIVKLETVNLMFVRVETVRVIEILAEAMPDVRLSQTVICPVAIIRRQVAITVTHVDAMLEHRTSPSLRLCRRIMGLTDHSLLWCSRMVGHRIMGLTNRSLRSCSRVSPTDPSLPWCSRMGGYQTTHLRRTAGPW